LTLDRVLFDNSKIYQVQ